MKPSEYHACATGDCTHETQAECTAAMIALADDQAQEIDRLTAELAAIREVQQEGECDGSAPCGNGREASGE